MSKECMAADREVVVGDVFAKLIQLENLVFRVRENLNLVLDVLVYSSTESRPIAKCDSEGTIDKLDTSLVRGMNVKADSVLLNLGNCNEMVLDVLYKLVAEKPQ